MVKYLSGTLDYGIKATKYKRIKISVYVDASFGQEYENKSRTGYVIFVNDCPTVFESRKQSVVALSSAEAEYMALTACIRQVQWLQSLLWQLFKFNDHVIVLTDNKPSMQIARSVNGSKLTRHISIRYHFIKEILNDEDNNISLEYCPTDKMVADVFTKILSGEKFTNFRSFLVTSRY